MHLFYILCTFRYSGIEESVDDDLGTLFVRLSRAVAVEGEETISIPELKMVIVKALNGLIAKLDTKTQADEEISLLDRLHWLIASKTINNAVL